LHRSLSLLPLLPLEVLLLGSQLFLNLHLSLLLNSLLLHALLLKKTRLFETLLLLIKSLLLKQLGLTLVHLV
jgi:hypothetical protein